MFTITVIWVFFFQVVVRIIMTHLCMTLPVWRMCCNSHLLLCYSCGLCSVLELVKSCIFNSLNQRGRKLCRGLNFFKCQLSQWINWNRYWTGDIPVQSHAKSFMPVKLRVYRQMLLHVPALTSLFWAWHILSIRMSVVSRENHVIIHVYYQIVVQAYLF